MYATRYACECRAWQEHLCVPRLTTGNSRGALPAKPDAVCCSMLQSAAMCCSVKTDDPQRDRHPFTVSGLECTGNETEMQPVGGASTPQPIPMGITVHIKSMGDGTWSDRLLTAVKQQKPMVIRLEGPYGEMGVDLVRYSHILSVSGGIGFTPCAPLLQMVLDPQRRHECLPLLKSLTVVWVVRSRASLSWFEGLLAKALALRLAPDFRLNIELYVTRPDPSTPYASLPPLPPSLPFPTPLCPRPALSLLPRTPVEVGYNRFHPGPQHDPRTDSTPS